MRATRFFPVLPCLALSFALAACAGDDAPAADPGAEDAAMPAATPAVPATTPAAGVTADIEPLDGATVSGLVTVAPAATGTGSAVTVMLRGVAAPGVHQGHIHGGTCAERTGALVPLEPVTTDASGSGTSTATVDLPLATLTDGQHIIVYHEAGGSPGASIACAQIPAQG